VSVVTTEHPGIAKSRTVVDTLRQRVERTPEAIAFHVLTRESGWRPVTWAAFGKRVDQLAASLAASAVGPGDRVAICAWTSLDWEVAQMAALSLGASVVALDTAYPDELLSGLIVQLNVRVLVAQDAAILARLPESVLSGLELVLTIENSNVATMACRSLADLVTAGAGDARPRAGPGPADEALVVFSSGTTGSPKPVCYCHGQVALALDTILEAFSDIGEGSNLVCWLPLANLFQRMINFAAMARGASTYVVEDPRTVMDHLGTANPDVFIGVPRFFEKVCAAVNDRIEAQPPLPARLARWAMHTGQRRARALRSGRRPSLPDRLAWPVVDRWVLRRIRATFGAKLRYFISGSAPMPYWLLEWFEGIGLPVLEAYGVSENIVPIAASRYDVRKPGTVGKPLPGQEVRLGDDDEILVRGPGVALDDIGSRGAAHAAWAQSRSLATGDLGQFDADGFLRVAGRKADVFKTSGGKWVAPNEIEGRLRQLPYIEHAVALGASRKAIIALVWVAAPCRSRLLAEIGAARRTDGAPNAGEGGPLSQLRDDIARKLADLPPYQHPAGVLVLDAGTFTVAGGELTTNLKVRRRHVEAKFADAIERMYSAINRAGLSRSPGFPLVVVDGAKPAP